MRDLADLMNDALAERAGSLADLPTAQVGDRLHRRVRFRRARRHTLEAGGATAACAVLGATAWFGVNGFRQDPGARGQPDGVADSVARLGRRRRRPPRRHAGGRRHLRPAADLRDAGRAARADDAGLGAVGIYRSLRRTSGERPGVTRPNGVVNTVVLVSPTGDMYRVVDLPGRHGGLAAAVGGRDDHGDRQHGGPATSAGDAARAVLDLVTGERRHDDRVVGGNLVRRGDRDGAELWLDCPTAPLTTTGRSSPGRGRRQRAEPVGLVGSSVGSLDPTGRWAGDTARRRCDDRPRPFALLDLVDDGGPHRGLRTGSPGSRARSSGGSTPASSWCAAGTGARATAGAPSPDPSLWRGHHRRPARRSPAGRRSGDALRRAVVRRLGRAWRGGGRSGSGPSAPSTAGQGPYTWRRRCVHLWSRGRGRARRTSSGRGRRAETLLRRVHHGLLRRDGVERRHRPTVPTPRPRCSSRCHRPRPTCPPGRPA